MATSREDQVRGFVDAYNRGDLDAIAAWADPGIEWMVARQHPTAATHHGVAAIRAYHEDWLRLFPGMRIEVESVEERGDRILAVTRIRGVGAGSGATADVKLGILSTYRGDRAIRVEEFLDPEEARRELAEGNTPRNGEDGGRSAK
jgi:ketosteroid isomerase-like protein